MSNQDSKEGKEKTFFLPIFRMLKQQDLQVGWKFGKDIWVIGIDGEEGGGLQFMDQNHSYQ